ncbi:MAG: MFS transporter [bacterium]
METKKLSLKEKVGFGVCDVGGNALFTIVAFWLMNYLTDTVGLAAGLAGVALMIGKIWDAAVDPIIGFVSDRTRSRLGRRKPYILIGGVFVFISMIFMFTNPKISDQSLLFAWAISAYCILCLAYSIVNIPYSSLTPELTADFHERTVLNGYRMTFALVGTFLGAGAVLPIVGLFSDENTGYTAMGAIFGLLIMAVSLTTFFVIKERPSPVTEKKMGILKSYVFAFKNAPYLLILFPWVFNIVAVTIVSGILVYYFKYIYRAEGMTTMALLILLGSTMVFIPMWVKLSPKVGKNRSYAIGMFIVAFACTLAFFFGHTLGMNFVFFLMGVAGVGLSATYVSPWAIIPDTVEYDYVKTGERREGVYYGIWTFASQVGQALASLLMGGILSLSHYVPNQAIQSSEAQFGIRLLLGPMPALIFILGAAVVLFYPIDEGKYREIMERAKAMTNAK